MTYLMEALVALMLIGVVWVSARELKHYWVSPRGKKTARSLEDADHRDS